MERPDGGDFARGYDRSVHGDFSYFVWLNRGKESLTLDLKHAQGQRILHRLLTSADVLVQTCDREPPRGWAWTPQRSQAATRR